MNETKHELAAADGGSADDDFVVQVLGGACSMRDTCEVVHEVRAIARNDTARDFCDHRNVFRSAAFECHAYTTVPAGAVDILARAWAHRMQYFFNVALANDDFSMAFTQATLDEYLEPTEFSELKRTAALPAILRQRQANISGLFA